MTTGDLRLEEVLYVGQRVFFSAGPHRRKGQSTDAVVRGWQRDGYILLELLGGREQQAIFRRGTACSTRFLKDGLACAIDCIVLDSHALSERPTVRISWAGRVRTASLRRAERIEVRLACTIGGLGQACKGEVRDMSTGGIGIALDAPVQTGARLEVSCRLPDGVEVRDLPVIVRNQRKEPAGSTLIGCSFTDEHERDAQAVGFYVTSALMRQRGAYEDTSTVLILDDDALTISILQKRLTDAGHECEVHHNLLDGVFRARLKAPSAILIRFHWGDLTALEVCRLLRQGHALQSTALFVYGEEAHERSLELRRAGATGTLASHERPAEVLDYLAGMGPEAAAG